MRALFLAVPCALLLAGCSTALKVLPEPGLQSYGLSVTRATRAVEDPNVQTVNVYVVFERDFSGLLELYLYDGKTEVGRTGTVVKMTKGGRYIDFTFDRRTPLFTNSTVMVKATPLVP